MNWNKEWEENIYSEGKALNKYPYDILVSIVARKYFSVEKRKEVKFLDLGCGAGNNSKFLAKEGFSVWGIDGSETAIKVAKRRMKTKELEGKTNFMVGDFTELPFDNNKFDCIIDRQSVSANNKKEIKNIISKEVYRVLKEGGSFISFISSNSHPQKEYGEKIKENTYNNFEKGSFEGVGEVHFCDLKEIFNFYSPFKIENIINHKLKEIYSQDDSFLDMAEYIIIASKEEKNF